MVDEELTPRKSLPRLRLLPTPAPFEAGKSPPPLRNRLWQRKTGCPLRPSAEEDGQIFGLKALASERKSPLPPCRRGPGLASLSSAQAKKGRASGARFPQASCRYFSSKERWRASFSSSSSSSCLRCSRSCCSWRESAMARCSSRSKVEDPRRGGLFPPLARRLSCRALRGTEKHFLTSGIGCPRALPGQGAPSLATLRPGGGSPCYVQRMKTVDRPGSCPEALPAGARGKLEPGGLVQPGDGAWHHPCPPAWGALAGLGAPLGNHEKEPEAPRWLASFSALPLIVEVEVLGVGDVPVQGWPQRLLGRHRSDWEPLLPLSLQL